MLCLLPLTATSGDTCFVSGKGHSWAGRGPRPLAAKDFSGCFTCSCKYIKYPEGTRHVLILAASRWNWPCRILIAWPGKCMIAGAFWPRRIGMWKWEKGHSSVLFQKVVQPVFTAGDWARSLVWGAGGSFLRKEAGFINQKKTTDLAVAARKRRARGN